MSAPTPRRIRKARLRSAMAKNNKSPTVIGGRSDQASVDAKWLDRPDHRTSDTGNVKSEYWLHVRHDGREIRYNSKPKELCLYVRRVGPHEFTWTRNIEFWFSASCEIVPVKPRGRGWELFNASNFKSTVWRRRHSGGEKRQGQPRSCRELGHSQLPRQHDKWGDIARAPSVKNL